MTDMIDGPMLVGIAALITSLANVVTILRPPDRPQDRLRLRRVPRRRKGREDRNLRA
ncbi:hypothetical protein [Sphingomonas xinjiangensis]|uniref:Uncharacterized protein n=1 Tax=Sphingomonas xinjiangensis TaxID=643568 RepID=A0A840YSW1_9SPHN|nr:hypothetical protein [Sphingomonas xinjiangensis]MBB5712760.1 hypothetical protein [Sphingomonas xinjiangensis]